MNTLKNYYEKYPLTIIILVAFIIRMFSVLFAKGYGMHDDHFLIIETSRSWASGWDFQGWLQTIPQGHSFTYPLLLFFFKLLIKISFLLRLRTCCPIILFPLIQPHLGKIFSNNTHSIHFSAFFGILLLPNSVPFTRYPRKIRLFYYP